MFFTVQHGADEFFISHKIGWFVTSVQVTFQEIRKHADGVEMWNVDFAWICAFEVLLSGEEDIFLHFIAGSDNVRGNEISGYATIRKGLQKQEAVKEEWNDYQTYPDPQKMSK